jgi:hypothetical protein
MNGNEFRFPLSFVSIARGCRAQLFVRGKLIRLFTVFVSSIEARSTLFLSSREITVNTARIAAAFMFMFNISEEKKKRKREVRCE